MHKGWWIGVVVVIVLVVLGGIVHYSTRDGDTSPTIEPDVSPDVDFAKVVVDSELMLIPTSSLGFVSQMAVEAVKCVRVCAVPGENEGALEGHCSAPLTVTASFDNEDGIQLVIGVAPEAAPDAYAYLAARDRRLVIVSPDLCSPPGDDL